MKRCFWLVCRSMPYFETSAATGQNVTKAVECLLNKVMLRIEAAVDKSLFRVKAPQDGKEIATANGCSSC